MSQYCNLSPTDQLKVDRKLAELQTNTGQSWHCEITQLPKGHKRTLLLEVSVNGRIARPIPLEEDDTNPAESICGELEKLSARQQPNRTPITH